MDHDDHDDDRELPTTNHPLNGERRPLVTPILGVLALVVLVAAIVAVLTFLTDNT